MKRTIYAILIATFAFTGCGDKCAAYKREKLCKEIVDNDTISKQYYFRYMDFWKKSYTPDWVDSDADSMQFYIEKLRSSREEQMEGLDSITRWVLYKQYIDKVFEWEEEWCRLNDMLGAPLLVY